MNRKLSRAVLLATVTSLLFVGATGAVSSAPTLDATDDADLTGDALDAGHLWTPLDGQLTEDISTQDDDCPDDEQVFCKKCCEY